MKNHLLSVAAVLAALVSCQEKPETPVEDNKSVTLMSPADKIEIEASVDQEVTFKWSAEGEVGQCELALSLSQRLTNPQTIGIGSGSEKTMTGREFVDAVIALGIEEGVPTNVYWSVRPVDGAKDVETQVRYMKVTCSFPTIVLNSPANLIEIGGTGFPVNFSFEKVASVEDYLLKFSKDETFPADATVQYELDADSWEMDEAKFNAILEGLSVEGTASADIYWTVASADDALVVKTQSRRFTARRPAMSLAAASWTFDDKDNLFKADKGADIQAFGDVPYIAGPGAGNGAVHIDVIGRAQGNYLKAVHGIAPNVGDNPKRVNEYTILMDVRLPSLGYTPLIHSDASFKTEVAVLGITDGGQLAQNGAVLGDAGAISANRWHRIVLTSKCGVHWNAYVDGQLKLLGNVADYSQYESKFALDPEGVIFGVDAEWFSDCKGKMDIAQITIWGEALGEDAIASLGGVPEY